MKQKDTTQTVSKKRKVILAASLLLTVCLTVGITVAWLRADTASRQNTFTLAKVSCEVEETFDGTVKEDVSIRNTGTADAYIRAAIVVTWMKDGDDSNQTVSSVVPQLDKDYTIQFTKNSGWIQLEDGYWYYTKSVPVGGSTAELIDSCTLLDGAEAPEGYRLAVEIIASAIQSSPAKVAEENWRVKIDETGTIIRLLADGEVAGA